MEIKEYCEKAERTRSKLDNKLLDNMHMSFGLVTEAGEIADIFKKHMAYNKPIDWTNLQEEIGDLVWYLAGFCNINGFNLSDILQNNIDKLKARYPDKFTEHNAIHRDLEKERKILEELGY